MNKSFYFLPDWSFDTLLLYLAIVWPLVPKLTRMSTFCVVAFRAVHGLGRVGFVPNPNLTRLRRMGENLTQNQPEDLVEFSVSALVSFGLIRVGLEFYHRDQNLAGSGKI